MIILSGGGKPEDIVPVNRYFSLVVDSKKTVLYIPLAAEAQEIRYEECYEEFKRTFLPYGISKIELCTDLNAVDIDGKYGAVYISGGNTFKLLDKIRHSDFTQKIKTYLEAGGVLYGSSAGAIVCGQTIEPAIPLDQNRVGIEDLTAMDLLHHCDVFCHYDRIKYGAFINACRRSLYLLYEESGLVFHDSRILSVGRPFEQKMQ